MLKNRLVEKKYASTRSGSNDLYQLWCNENPKKIVQSYTLHSGTFFEDDIVKNQSKVSKRPLTRCDYKRAGK